jgi:hypothetical protein
LLPSSLPSFSFCKEFGFGGDGIEDRDAHAEGVGAGDAGEGNFAPVAMR